MRLLGVGALILVAVTIATFGSIAAYGAYHIRFRWHHSPQGAIEISLIALISLLSLLLACQVGAAAFSIARNR